MYLRIYIPNYILGNIILIWIAISREVCRCYLCSVVSGSLTLLEHEAAAWLDREHLHSVKWLPADAVILDEIEKLL